MITSPTQLPLPIPPWHRGVGEISVGFAGVVRCRYHYTELGHTSYKHKVCPYCTRMMTEHEIATRDD